MEEGGKVFTYRPERKPGSAPLTTGHGRANRPAPPPDIQQLISEVSLRYDLDPWLVTSVISVESGFNRRAVSHKGARGLMQLMPETARQYGVRDVYDPRENVEGGVAYLRDLAQRYKGDIRLALAAYNAGPEAVERAAGVPRYRETTEYLRKIEARYGQKLTVSGLKSGGTATPQGGGSIRTARDENGHLVATNHRGPRARSAGKYRRAGP